MLLLNSKEMRVTETTGEKGENDHYASIIIIIGSLKFRA